MIQLLLHRMCCAWCMDGAEVFLRHFGTSAEVSQHFWKGPKCLWDTSALVPNCLGSEMSRVRSVRRAHYFLLSSTVTEF